jgi:hypothetical protein
VREYNIEQVKDLAQKLILLGFGMAGRELAAKYDISNFGPELVWLARFGALATYPGSVGGLLSS